MFKRKAMAFIAICLSACLTVLPVNATVAGTTAVGGNSPVMPCMEYINDSGCQLSINGSTANVYAFAVGASGLATKCEITIELQERSFLFFWNTVEAWTCSESGYQAEIDETTTVSSGTTYRLVATVTVWSGSQSETQTLTSDTAKAP